MSTRSVIFLHIPKTAGQSIHAYLQRLFGADQVSPARVNAHLTAMTVPELRRHKVYSGHFDWALLDCLPEPQFTFTVLREPMERILSFYFYLRKEAALLTEADLMSPARQGMRAALRLTPDEYFVSKSNGVRGFLDNHYDNFYTYYFAGRTYDARQRLVGMPASERSDDRLLDMAMQNISTLDGVYDLDRLDLLVSDLQRVSGVKEASGLPPQYVNRGDGRTLGQRLGQLREMGATDATFDRLKSMTRLDQLIWMMPRQAANGGLVASAAE